MRSNLKTTSINGYIKEQVQDHLMDFTQSDMKEFSGENLAEITIKRLIYINIMK